MDSGMNNGYGTQQYNTQLPNQGSAPGYLLWLILGILQILPCCCNCFSLIFGVITVIFVLMANSEFKKGNIINFQSKLRAAKIINITGWIVCILFTIIGLVIGLFKGFLNMITNW